MQVEHAAGCDLTETVPASGIFQVDPAAALFGNPSHLERDVSTTPQAGNQPAGRPSNHGTGPLDSPPVQIRRNGSRNPAHGQHRIGPSNRHSRRSELVGKVYNGLEQVGAQ